MRCKGTAFFRNSQDFQQLFTSPDPKPTCGGASPANICTMRQ